MSDKTEKTDSKTTGTGALKNEVADPARYERELRAVAVAERDPATAMAEGKTTATDTPRKPVDPLNPETDKAGEN